MSRVDCCSDCRSVLTAMNSTPSTSASTMRLTALTPAPPTPTTRSTGPCDLGARRRGSSRGAVRRAALRAALEDVLRDVGREGCAQALLRRGRAMLAARSAGSGRRHAATGAERAASARPARGAAAARPRRRLRPRLGRPLGRGVASSSVSAEEGRERALAHARALTACHWRGPPSRARGRTGPPMPSGSYLSTDMPFTGASAKRIVF